MIASDPTIDYSKTGMNNRLQSGNSLANKTRFTTATEFQNSNEANSVGNYNMGSVNASKINAGTIVAEVAYAGSIGAEQIDAGTISADIAYAGTLTFDQLKGGTATLGGTADGDGVLSVLSEAGTEIIRLDKSGVAINHGSITIKDSSGVTKIDSLGLVSDANFVGTMAVGGSAGPGFTVTGTAFEDIPGTDATISVSRNNTKILTTWYFAGLHTQFITNGYSGGIQLMFGTQAYDLAGVQGVYNPGYAGSVDYENKLVYRIIDANAGEIVAKLQLRNQQASGTAVLQEMRLICLTLGA